MAIFFQRRTQTHTESAVLGFYYFAPTVGPAGGIIWQEFLLIIPLCVLKSPTKEKNSGGQSNKQSTEWATKSTQNSFATADVSSSKEKKISTLLSGAYNLES